MMNVWQFRFVVGCTYIGRLLVIAIKLSNYVTLRKTDYNGCNEQKYDCNKVNKTTDTVLGVCWTSERGHIPNAVENSSKQFVTGFQTKPLKKDYFRKT